MAVVMFSVIMLGPCGERLLFLVPPAVLNHDAASARPSTGTQGEP